MHKVPFLGRMHTNATVPDEMTWPSAQAERGPSILSNTANPRRLVRRLEPRQELMLFQVPNYEDWCSPWGGNSPLASREGEKLQQYAIQKVLVNGTSVVRSK